MRLMGTNKKFNWCLSFVLLDIYLAVKWNFCSWYTLCKYWDCKQDKHPQIIKTIHELTKCEAILSNKPWSLLKTNATMSEIFCQTHGVHVPKWEWKESIATWIHQNYSQDKLHI